MTADPTFIKNFLMTFKSFMTVDELFELLTKRYWISPPPNLKPTELEEWTRLKQQVIRMRYVCFALLTSVVGADIAPSVLNTFRTMVTDEDVLEKDDMYILDKIREFASNPEVSNSTAAAKQLVILIDRVVRIHREMS